MTAPSILLGAILTFQASDGERLQLTVSLTQPATCALDWDGLVKASTAAATRHVFHDLPRPRDRALVYTLRPGASSPERVTVTALSKPKMKIALYGDTREGDGPHRLLIRQMIEKQVDLVIHTGDVVLHAGDEEGWVHHLASTLPLAEKAPIILALGNHEMYTRGKVDALARALEKFPPPTDPKIKEYGAPPAAFHVRLGPLLILSLDSNASLAKGSQQYRYAEDVLSTKGDARLVFVALHHGPLSSGPHGPHPDGEDIVALFERYGVTASLAGHDHTYERLVKAGVTYLVSGGGGAPLYQRSRFEEGSQVFAPTYNWVLITVEGDSADLEAYSLEGALLDRAVLAPPARFLAEPKARATDPRLIFVALGVLFVGFVFATYRLSRMAG